MSRNVRVSAPSVMSCIYGSVALGIAYLATGCATSAPQPRRAAPPVSAEEQAAARQAAESTALAWFGLLDAEKYTESWSAASTFFRKYSYSQSLWRVTIDQARHQLGPLRWRKLESAVFAQTIPDYTPEGRWLAGREGDYVIAKFSSSYLRFDGTETVIVMKDSDGAWRAADYYIASADAASCTGSRICR